MRPLIYSCVAIVGAALLAAGATAQDAVTTFGGLPSPIRSEIERVHKECADLHASYAANHEMQGLMFVELAGRPVIVVDNLHLCNSHVPGANCSNRGCDVTIWQQDGSGAWKQVFHEHLHERTFLLDRAQKRLEGMSLAIHAGHPWCNPQPGKEYTSGQSCRLTIHYVDGKWVPQRRR
jgi:hypothetical protein